MTAAELALLVPKFHIHRNDADNSVEVTVSFPDPIMAMSDEEFQANLDWSCQYLQRVFKTARGDR